MKRGDYTIILTPYTNLYGVDYA